MNVKLLQDAVTSKFGRQILTIQKNSPAILFAAGVVGVVGTVVLACKATLKVESVLEDHAETLEKIETVEHPNYSEADRVRDKTRLYFRTAGELGRLYGPPVILGVMSIAALTGAHVTLSRRNAAAIAAYAAVEKGFKAYRDRVVKELGEDKDREFRYGYEEREIVEETDKGPQTILARRVGPDGASMYARYFDDSCPLWSKQPEYNYLTLKCQQNFANDKLNSRGHLFLNEVYDMLGIKHTQEGSVVGWIKGGNGDGFVDFGIFDGDRRGVRDFVNGWQPYVLLDFNVDGIIYDKI